MAADWRGARNLLGVRLDEMGDLLMTTPALRAVKGRDERRITLLTSRAGADIARFVPEVDEVIVHEAPWIKSAPPGRRGDDEIAMAAELRARRFDAAMIFTVFSQSPLPAAYLCHLGDIPWRAGYCRENPYQLLTDHLEEIDVAPDGVRHEVQRQLDLVTALGFSVDDLSLSLHVPDVARAETEALLAPLGLDDAWVLLHPGATAESRRYPPEHFAEAADLLVERTGWRVLFTGDGDDVAVVEDVRARMRHPSLSVAGELALDRLLALIERAPMLVTNNTGPAHIAAALGTPVVVTYAQTNLQHTPWTEKSRVLWHDVPCKYCLKSVCPERHHACLRLVRPQQVVAGALDLARDGLGWTRRVPFHDGIAGTEARHRHSRGVATRTT